MTNDCELCIRAGGRYNFSKVCCRARFIVNLPTRSLRAGWIEHWGRKDKAMADKVEAEVLRMWEARKLAKAFPHLKLYETCPVKGKEQP